MATLTLVKIRTLVRSNKNNINTSLISDLELNAIINDGYKDVCIKSLCYEKKITKTNILSGVSMVPILTDNIVNINFVEYDLGSSGCIGMVEVIPNIVGRLSVDNYTPQFWFQWGDYLIIDPVPAVSTYDLNIYASCYPDTVITNDFDTPLYLPTEFHESIINFCTYAASIKLKRWADISDSYNYYINDLQRKRYEYINKQIDYRMYTEIPNSVTLEAKPNG